MHDVNVTSLANYHYCTHALAFQNSLKRNPVYVSSPREEQRQDEVGTTCVGGSGGNWQEGRAT